MIAELQGQILEAGRDAGLLPADLVHAARGARLNGGGPLKDLVDRQGLSKSDLDRVLERFWAQHGARRGQIHRDAEDRVLAQELVARGFANEAQVAAGLRERDQRQSGGGGVRLLSVLVDAGVVVADKAREVLDATRASAKFCRYCLSAFKGAAADVCDLCGRPLSPVARSYELTELSTIAADTAPEGTPGVGGAVAEPPPVGSTLAGVKLLEKVDEEGRGVVYRGARVGDGEARAVKVWQLSAGITYEDVVRFGGAALGTAKLTHPGILKVYEAGEEESVHFVVSEWVEGRTLNEHVKKKGPLDPKLVTEIGLKLCSALGAAHAEQILHKNVAPQNMYLADDGSVKLADFGECGDYGVSLQQVAGNLIGAPAFLAPEQCEGQKADVRTDVYSFGLTLYFALSGKLPFEGDSPASIAVKRLTQQPPPLGSVAPKAPRGLVKIVERMIERKPERRFASVADVAAALEAFKNPPPTFLGKHGKKLAIVGAVLLLLGGGGAYIAWTIANQPTDPAIVAEVRVVETLIREREFVRAQKKLADVERMYGVWPESTAARERICQEGLAAGKQLAEAKDFRRAVATLEAVEAAAKGTALAGEATTALGDAQAAAEAYETEARAAYFKLEAELEGRPDAEVEKRLGEYVAAYPFTELAERAAGIRSKAEARLKVSRAIDQVSARLAGLVPQDPSFAPALILARQELTTATTGMDPSASPERLERVRADLELMEHVQEALDLARGGDHQQGIEQLEVYAKRAGGDVRVQRALAEARYLDARHRGDADYRAKDLKAALPRYKEAERHAKDAGVDPIEVRERIAEIERSGTSGEERFARAERLEREGDALREQQRFRDAFSRYHEAYELNPSPKLQAKRDDASAKAGLEKERTAYEKLREDLKVARLDEAKKRLIADFLRDHPQSPYEPALKSEMESLGGATVDRGPVPGELLARGEGVFVSPVDGATMVLIPAGRFPRGTTAERIAENESRWKLPAGKLGDEQPVRTVELDAFYIDVYEVTNAQYARFLDALAALPDPRRFDHPDQQRGKDHTPELWSVGAWSAPELPVVGVDWFDAYAYAQWAGKRLPTEAEWERAARGTDGRRYPWGNDLGRSRSNGAEAISGLEFESLTDWKARFLDKKPGTEGGLTVGPQGFPLDLSPAGCRHMAGNVWEWCADWYAADAYARLGDKRPLQADPVGEKPKRVVRGGGWVDPALYHRVTSRRELEPTRRNKFLGFRCVRDGR